MKTAKKALVLSLCAVVLVAASVMGTVAWLTAQDSVVNTFTFGNLDVTLTETERTYNIIPGTNISKDPEASVEAVAGYAKIDAYLFVKVDEVNWPEAKMADGSARKVDYKIADGWTLVPGETGAYYRTVSAAEYGTKYPVLMDNQVTVDGSLTKAEIETAQTAGTPSLNFTAYAVQKDNLSVEQAWAQAKALQ